MHISLRIKWYRPEDGGLNELPEGPIYAANLSIQDQSHLWSVILRFSDTLNVKEGGSQTIEADFLFPENIAPLIQEGDKVLILEGPQRVVAKGVVTSTLI